VTLLDTCVLIFDALTPERLSAPARGMPWSAEEAQGLLVCADISLWEIAMLVSKGRLEPGTDSATFCRLALDARGVRVPTRRRSRPGVREHADERVCPVNEEGTGLGRQVEVQMKGSGKPFGGEPVA
jgi:hypothetical protein